MSAVEVPVSSAEQRILEGLSSTQREAVLHGEGPLLIIAGAGTGKTTVLTRRIAHLIASKRAVPEEILALTFTEKAAGELRERIRRRFTELGEFEHARAAEGAAIGTIHGFCAGVLRAHPFAAGLDPRFTVLDEAAARRLRSSA